MSREMVAEELLGILKNLKSNEVVSLSEETGELLMEVMKELGFSEKKNFSKS